jgi:hypothetical protein
MQHYNRTRKFKAIRVDGNRNPIAVPKPNKPSPKPRIKRFEYRVVWQRNMAIRAKSRKFESEALAFRFGNRLLNAETNEWAPIRFVRVDRREVSAWQVHEIRERR